MTALYMISDGGPAKQILLWDLEKRGPALVDDNLKGNMGCMWVRVELLSRTEQRIAADTEDE